MYNMESDTYSCDICDFEMGWDDSDEIHGEMWGCEKCGISFCTACFIKARGAEAYSRMMQDCNLVMCPECYSKYCEEEPENE